MACDVVAHLETREPELARVMWGERRGCFEKPEPGIVPTVRTSSQSAITLLRFNVYIAGQTRERIEPTIDVQSIYL